jgi:hypothetical protein
MNTSQIIAAVVGAFVAVITAGMPAMIALLKIQELHVMINSRLSQLIEAAKAVSLAQGEIAGRNAVRAEIAIQTAAEATNAGNTSRPA